MISAHARQLAITTVASLAVAGCQLTFDPGDYPYTPTLIEPDTGADSAPDTTPDVAPDAPDVVPDVPPDLPDPVGPRLLFSELLMDSSFVVNNSNEVGEFFEVVNIGDEDAVMARVSISFSSPDDAAFSDSWGVLPGGVRLPPEAFFLIHRGDTPDNDFEMTIPSTRRYDVNVGNGLSNTAFRRADLVYDGEIHDSIFWEGGDLQLCTSGGDLLSCPPEDLVVIAGAEGASFFLRDGSRTPEASKEADAWCLSSKVYVTGLNGYPGTRNPDVCP